MRILFFAEAVTLAHVARPIVLALAAMNAGHEVIIACSRRYDWLLEKYGFQTVDLPSISPAEFASALAWGKPLYQQSRLESYVQDDIARIEQWQPDVVVGDFRLSLSISARLTQVHYATITNAYWSPFGSQRYIVPSLPITRIFPIPLAQKLFDLARPLAFSVHALPLNAVRKKYGLGSLGSDLRRVYTDADLVLYADVPRLFPRIEAPKNHVFLGPILWSPPLELPSWWKQIPDDRPIIYATPGSSGHGNLLSTVVSALSQLPVTVLAATAGVPLGCLQPSNCFVADYLPGDVAAGRSSLVICNGGSPTSQQGLAARVPILGIPSNLDQFLNMDSIVVAGAGVKIRADRISEEEICAAVELLLGTEQYKNIAAKIGAELCSFDACDAFLFALKSLFTESQTPLSISN